MSRPKRAVQYVRMSTEHQQYSVANQKDAIGAYAATRGIEIVASYEDSGKSGLTLAGRPSLRKLIADVVAGQDAFDTILVYDVSRWGRFQDADESAHLEFLCRLSGVQVEYCAEPFTNDGTPFASICKVVKRALAAEYSRELSNKVFAGKRRLIELGFRQGGSAGYGLRRCLVDQTGHIKGLLSPGEYKSIATDRVILVPGPSDEVTIVRGIYRDYIERQMSSAAIAAVLNRDGIRSESGRPWSKAMIRQILSSEKYVGDNVWGRTSFKLQKERRRNISDAWTRCSGAFQGIVSRRVFEKARKIRVARAGQISDEQIISRLRFLFRKNGEVSARIISEDGFIGSDTVRRRFGGLTRAYERAGFQPTWDVRFLSLNETAQRLRARTAQALEEGIAVRGGTIEHIRGTANRFVINGEIRTSLVVAKQRRSKAGNPRWMIARCPNDDLVVAVLMDGRQERARTYYFFPTNELDRSPMLAPRNSAHIEAFRSDDLEPLFRLCERREICARGLVPLTGNARSPPERGRSRAVVLPLPQLSGAKSLSDKSYTGAFLRISATLREAISKAEAVHTQLHELRLTLTGLMRDPRFVRQLQGVGTVPRAAFPVEPRIQHMHTEVFPSLMRAQALDLLAGNALTSKTRALLDKLTPERRIEAGEIMVLVNDPSEATARALVAATGPSGLIRSARKHICGGNPRLLRQMVEENACTFREAKRVLAGFGRDALGLIVLTAFARRLLAISSVVAWLELHHEKAFHDLRRTSILHPHRE